MKSLPPELSESVNSIKAAIERLNSNQLHQLSKDRSITQDSFDSTTQSIKEELDRVNNNLDELEILADECEEESTRSDALGIVEEYRKETIRLRASLRTISLDVKRQISNNLLQTSRAELLAGSTITSKPRPSNPEEALMSATSDVTQSLRNTLEVMRQELDRSVVSTHMLEQQTTTLQLTSDQYFTFGELMKTSRALISALKRADLLDRILLSGAILIFFLVCLYILKKRIFRKGISLFSTILSPLNRHIVNNNKMIIVGSSSNNNNPDDILTAAAVVATATAAALIPSLVPPDIPSANPVVQEIKEPIPDLPSSSSQKLSANELGSLHQEL